MNRPQYLAVVVGLAALGGLIAVNVGDSDATDAEGFVPTSSDSSTSSDSAEADGEPDLDDLADGEPTTTTVLADTPPVLGEAGDLVDLDGWLQTDATQFSDFDGTVRVVQFWTFGCINCRNTLENLRGLYDEFGPRGLEVIGVHAPEFDHEADPVAIAQAAVDLGVTWPIALDTDKTNFRAWQPGRRFWPRTFVLDRNGNIRFDRIGEGAYDELNATVAWLIDNEGA